jgi:hypothetical protein
MDGYNTDALFAKWMIDWEDTSNKAIDNKPPANMVFGNVPNTAPTFSGSGGPMWGGITVSDRENKRGCVLAAISMRRPFHRRVCVCLT